MSFRFEQTQTQIQKLALTQEMRQSLDLLQYSSEELHAFLQEKQVENPFLKIKVKSSKNQQAKDWVEWTASAESDSIQSSIMDQLLNESLSPECKKAINWLINDFDDFGFLEQPLLDVRIYKHPMFALSSAISIVVSMAMFSGMIITPIYVQTVRGISPLDAGLLMLPGALVMGIMSPITGKLFDKFGPKALALTGLTITTIATYELTKLTADTSYGYLMFAYTIRMFGMSMVMMPIMTNGLNQLPMKMNPHGTAMNNTLQQVSGAIGSAVLITIMTKHTATRAKEIGLEMKEKMASAAQSGNVPSATEIAQMKAQVGQQALIDGINFSFFVAMCITIVAFILALFVKRVKVDGKSMNPTENTQTQE